MVKVMDHAGTAERKMSAIAFNERQLAWLKTRINQAASQVLVVPI
jgi:hypothetical protein